MKKQIKKITPLAFKENAEGFATVDIFHSDHEIEPFLVFTEFHMRKAVFGPHPHAGISVMTYMMPDSEGSFLNRDSNGDKSTIEPGGIHVAQAGKGLHHDEVPTVDGVDCHGFQIWINHADKDRLIEPKAFHAFSKDVPEVRNETSLIRVIQGEYEGMRSPIELVTKTDLLDVRLQPNTSITLAANEMAFVYLMDGSISIDESDIENRSLVTFEAEGDEVILSASENGVHFLFASGTPHNETIVYAGPFVMTTEEQMAETKRRMGRGEMGVLSHS